MFAQKRTLVYMAENRTSEKQQTEGERLLVVDGHSLAYRAYFALPAEKFSTASGVCTNAVFGFATMLLSVVSEIKPTHMAVAFDVKGGTFRNELLPQYKGTREASPEDLLPQFSLIKDLVRSLGIKCVEKQGFEGDDVIASLAALGSEEGMKTFVLSGDRDAFQLINENITVLYPGRHFRDLKHMDAEAIVEKYGVRPELYADLAAMRGEKSDNIPGVPGVGAGYAAKWLNKYGSLESIIEHIDEIGGKKGEALRENIEQVKLNRRVNMLVRDIDLNVSVSDFILPKPDVKTVRAVCGLLEFSKVTQTRVIKPLSELGIRKINHTKAEAKEIYDSAASVIYASRDDSELEDIDLSEPAVDHVINAQQLLEWADEDPEAELSEAGQREDKHFEAERSESEHPYPLLSVNATGSIKFGAAQVERIALCRADRRCVVLDMRRNSSQQYIPALKEILNKYRNVLAVHGYKEHIHYFASLGIEFPFPAVDTKLACYIAAPGEDMDSIDENATYFLRVEKAEDDKKNKKSKKCKDKEKESSDSGQGTLLDDEDFMESSQVEKIYSARCGHVLALGKYLLRVLAGREQQSLLFDIEMPVSETLAHMEIAGASVDVSRLHELLKNYETQAALAQETALGQIGYEINLQSPKQLQKLLFEDMGLTPTKKTKSGGYTTDADALQELYLRTASDERANLFLGAVISYRETTKFKQIMQNFSESVSRRDNRIHTTYSQTAVATGRLSSTAPNLQNVPIRTEEGKKVRSIFIPGDGYSQLLSCDYSQVELRIMAELSGDEALIEAFKSGIDFHKYVASLVYKINIDDVNAEQRSHVKMMSYGLAYGLSAYALAQQLKISPAAADVLKDKYFDTFGSVRDYLGSLVEKARENGYTSTLFGRRRYLPQLKSGNPTARKAAERAALNAPIQGTAADIMKKAMIRAENALKKEQLRSRIILQIHDELVVEVWPGEEEKTKELIRDAMENAVHLSVPLDVSIGMGIDWNAAAH